MSEWEEIERLTALVHQLPEADRLSRQQLNHVLVSAHSTMIEGSRVTVQSAFDFLVKEEAVIDPTLPWDGYDMLADHAQALDMALQWADEKRPVSVQLLQELAGAVMRTTGLRTNSILGSTDAARGDFRVDKVSIIGASSFPNAQKVPALVEQLTQRLRQRMDAATTLQDQLHIAFDAHQQLVSIHPFNDGNGRTSRLLMNYIQQYFGQPLTVVFREDKREYFAALEVSRQSEDLDVFRIFMLSQHIKSLNHYLLSS
ncbi:Fic family protein [Hymenobacter metallilatus]|uniref:Fic family protein n=1 Tax=Hymenobacter metallilatus TaxID=2493666 RepID=A0A428IY25_9BACT|nr:Fic family protein [Hymenobacter metallilatus]RSK23971.1 Fic family protein [Hymenobacter metallilatus]